MSEFKIPAIATGRIIPYAVRFKELEDAIEERRDRELLGAIREKPKAKTEKLEDKPKRGRPKLSSDELDSYREWIKKIDARRSLGDTLEMAILGTGFMNKTVSRMRSKTDRYYWIKKKLSKVTDLLDK